MGLSAKKEKTTMSVVEKVLERINELEEQLVKLREEWIGANGTYEMFLADEQYLKGQLDGLRWVVKLFMTQPQIDSNPLPY